MLDVLEDHRFPEDALPSARPAAMGLDPARLDALPAEIEARALRVHACLVVRRGYRVLERYGQDAGRQVGPDDLRPMHSVTKTVTATLAGLAITDGRLSLDTRVTELFAPGELAPCAPASARIRVEDLLTMRSGLDYEEGTAQDWTALTATPRPAAALLARPMRAEPGRRWNYSTGDSHLLAEALRRTTGRTVLELARERLFAPLGVRRVAWGTDADGAPLGGTGLHLRPRDLARLGWLLLSGGRWRGERLVPAAWIEAATRLHVVTDSGWTPGEGYGYHCWVPRLGGFAARGYQGQIAWAFPDRELLVVFASALEPADQADALLDDLVRRHVLPAVQG